jgi:hypothetical protein
VVLFWATFMREQGDFTTAQSDFNAARGGSESPTRVVLGAELAHRGRVLGGRGKVGKGAERKVKNHFIDHSYHALYPQLPYVAPCVARRLLRGRGWSSRAPPAAAAHIASTRGTGTSHSFPPAAPAEPGSISGTKCHQRPTLSTSSDLHHRRHSSATAPASQRHHCQRQQHRLQRAGSCGHRRVWWSGAALTTSAAGG